LKKTDLRVRESKVTANGIDQKGHDLPIHVSEQYGRDQNRQGVPRLRGRVFAAIDGGVPFGL